MKTSNINKLTYRRQYIISPKSFECPFDYRVWDLNSRYHLYAHIDLHVTSVKLDTVSLFLLGDIFDYEPDFKSNSEILNELIKLDFSQLLVKIEKYTGRYILIYVSDSSFCIIPDNTSSRKVYYTVSKDEIWFSSQPYLLGKILNYSETTIPSKKLFYESQVFIEMDGANVGDTTVFDNIKQLMPNHYFDANGATIFRFFPHETLRKIHKDEVCKMCAEILKGYMRNIVHRYDVMLPVTAGKDSRLLLAATKDLSSKVFYYVNKTSSLSFKSDDIVVPSKLFSDINIDFHVIDPYISVSNEFREVYFNTNKRSSLKYLPLIYNYYLNYSDKINLPGNIAFETYFLRRFPNIEITAENLARINRVDDFDFAKENYSQWLAKGKKHFDEAKIPILNMFYWEERIANWGTQIQTYKDIAQEEINPFNSRLLTELFLGIDYKLIIPPNYELHTSIIKQLWPDLLKTPINPSKRSLIKVILEKLRLSNTFLRIRNHLTSRAKS